MTLMNYLMLLLSLFASTWAYQVPYYGGQHLIIKTILS